MRMQYPEFLPNPTVKWRNVVREKLEREDMLKRRRNIDIPEFYVGSIMAVTSSDKHVAVKTKRYVINNLPTFNRCHTYILPAPSQSWVR